MKAILSVLALAGLMLSSASQAEQMSTLDQIKANGGIRIGYRPTLPPMSFKDSNGEVAGYSIDLCNEIAQAVGQKLGMSQLGIKYVPVDAKTRFTALTENKIDILCGSTTKTLSRQELVDFTDLTFVSGAALLSRADTPISRLGELNGRKLAVVEGRVIKAQA